MPSSSTVTYPYPGLSSGSVTALLKQHGHNEFAQKRRSPMLLLIWNTVREPMVLLLILSGVLYFLLGEYSEGIMMIVALFLVLAVSIFQEARSSKAINQLKEMIAPSVFVIRDGLRITVHTRDLVPGDVIWLEEGLKVPADAAILESHDLSVNEAVLTGESLPVEKMSGGDDKNLFQGTLVSSGSCFAVVTSTGDNTRLSSIGQLVDDPSGEKTVLQQQTGRIVKKLALFGLISFAAIFLVNYLHYRELTTSLLFALTLAMSVIPEEIPVAFTSFMALGAYKLSRVGIYIRRPQILENLGCMDVICFDKTGTITENRMTVHSLYDFRHSLLTEDHTTAPRLLQYGMLACEETPFDPMERAISEAWSSLPPALRSVRTAIAHEYPIGGTPPMMTHLFLDQEQFIVAGKGAPERIMRVCHLSSTEREQVQQNLEQMSRAGFRVLGVASAIHSGAFPETQDGFNWQFEGLIALYDPPKKTAPEAMRRFYDAKMEIKLVTGDYLETAVTIGQRAGIAYQGLSYTGDQIMQMQGKELQQAINKASIFARMYPEAKLKLVNELQAMGHTVGMTGDGVNDAPALKASSVGIAMGKRGTEMAQQAADLVIADDDLLKIAIAVNDGRKIFHNLKKSIRYIISIHIPILLIATLPVLLGWKFANIFTPVHIIFLELIMGPTCSIFFEREPVEAITISAGPRKKETSLLQSADLLTSIIQGTVIAAACLLLYYLFMEKGRSLEETRTMVFTTLILANILLTFSARSTVETIAKTIRYKNALTIPVMIVSLVFLSVILLYQPARALFGLTTLTPLLLLTCFATAIASVWWMEFYKAFRRKRIK